MAEPGCLSLAPRLRNKYIHYCTNIVIQKQHCQSVCTVGVGKDQPRKPLLLLVVVGWVPRDRDQPESMDVQRSWLFGLRGTLTSTHPRISGRAEVGLTASPSPASVLWSEPTAPRRASWPGWPEGLGASQHWPKLFGASRAWRGGAGKEGSGEPGSRHACPPRRCPLPGALPGPTWRGSRG